MNKPSQFMHDEYPSRSGCAWLFWLGVLLFLAITFKTLKAMYDPDTIKDYPGTVDMGARPTDTALYWVKYSHWGNEGNLFFEVQHNSLQDVNLQYLLNKKRPGATITKKVKLTPLCHER